MTVCGLKALSVVPYFKIISLYDNEFLDSRHIPLAVCKLSSSVNIKGDLYTTHNCFVFFLIYF